MQRRGFMKALAALAALPLISRMSFAQDIAAKDDEIARFGAPIRYMGTLNASEFERPFEKPLAGACYNIRVVSGKNKFAVYPTRWKHYTEGSREFIPNEYSYIVVQDGDQIVFDQAGYCYVLLPENYFGEGSIGFTKSSTTLLEGIHRNGQPAYERFSFNGRAKELTKEDYEHMKYLARLDATTAHFRAIRLFQNTTGVDRGHTESYDI